MLTKFYQFSWRDCCRKKIRTGWKPNFLGGFTMASKPFLRLQKKHGQSPSKIKILVTNHIKKKKNINTKKQKILQFFYRQYFPTCSYIVATLHLQRPKNSETSFSWRRQENSKISILTPRSKKAKAEYSYRFPAHFSLRRLSL